MIERITLSILVAVLAMIGFSPLFIAMRKLNQMQQCLYATHQYLECHNTIYRVDQRFNTLGDNREPAKSTPDY